jgi:hypothetical protein
MTVLWHRNRRNRNFLPYRNRNDLRIRFRNQIWIRIQYKILYNKKSQKIKNERPTFWEIIPTGTAFDIENARFCTNFLLENYAKYGLNSEPEPEPKADQEPKLFQSRNRNRNKPVCFHNTAK